jgi:hypothetical protein
MIHFSHRLNEPNLRLLTAIPKPIRSAYHPIHGNVDVRLGLTSTITLDDGTPVANALEKIKLKVAETLTAFKPEF